MNTIAGQMLYCRACGHQVHITASACPNCGAQQNSNGASDKRRLPAFLLCLFLGLVGAHRFYVGKVGTGILLLLTGGGFGLIALFDLVSIICGNFTDSEGRKITEWT